MYENFSAICAEDTIQMNFADSTFTPTGAKCSASQLINQTWMNTSGCCQYNMPFTSGGSCVSKCEGNIVFQDEAEKRCVDSCSLPYGVVNSLIESVPMFSCEICEEYT